MVEQTTDIKDTFIAEMILDTFDRFERCLAECATRRSANSKSVIVEAGRLQASNVQGEYRLDVSATPPCISLSITSAQHNPSYSFAADTEGSGVLNMRLVWKDQKLGGTLSTEELAEFCINQLLSVQD